ncbi:MAG: hypothetical protein ABH857_00930 [Elusimicrobiota bacterium]
MIKHLVLVFIFFGLLFQCLYSDADQPRRDNAQSREVLKNDVTQIKRKEQEFKSAAEALYRKSQEYLKKADYFQAMEYAQHAYSRAKSHELKAEALFVIAIAYEEMGKIHDAKIVLRQILKHFSEQKSVVTRARSKLMEI